MRLMPSSPSVAFDPFDRRFFGLLLVFLINAARFVMTVVMGCESFCNVAQAQGYQINLAEWSCGQTTFFRVEVHHVMNNLMGSFHDGVSL